MREVFQKALCYIEEELSNGVKSEQIQRLTGYSLAQFSRFFSMLTGLSLQEYIRNRKLSLAGEMLRNSDRSVLDIAMDFGYESGTSFAAACKDFHGASPSAIRKGASFRIFPKLKIIWTIEGASAMKTRIERKPAFRIAGIQKRGIESKDCPLVWEELFAKYSPASLAALGNGRSFGACFDMEMEQSLNYMAAYGVKDSKLAEAMGLSVLEVPAADYVVVELIGAIPASIHAGWKFLMQDFFPEQGYAHAGSPDFEVYGEGDMHAEDYTMELWVPIVKIEKEK